MPSHDLHKVTLAPRPLLHGLPSTERCDIITAKFKPFPIGPFVHKSLVPIGLNAKRIICPNNMNGVRWIRHLNRDCPTSVRQVICRPNLVPAPGLNQIDVAIFGWGIGTRTVILRSGFNQRLTYCHYVIESVGPAAKVQNFFQDLSLGPPTRERPVGREGWVDSRFHHELFFNGVMSQFTNEPDQFQNQFFILITGTPLIRSKARFDQRVTPPQPEFVTPVRDFDSSFSKKAILAKWLPAIRFSSPADFG
jgi:hypothetical protein